MVARLTRLLLAAQFGVAFLAALALERATALRFPTAFAAAVAAIAVLRFLIVANNFRLSRRHTPGGLPRVGLAGWLGLLWREYRASMVSSSWNMPFSEKEAFPSTPVETTPVLLLHGYGCNAGYWKPMRRALDRAGIPHGALTLEPVFGDIDDYLDDVDAAVRRLSAYGPNGRVILLAHSMGGVVGRAYLRRFGRGRISGLITLGSPHHGTALAHFSRGRNCEQMERSPCRTRAGEWLTALADAEPAATRELIVSIYSRHDNIIVPPSASMLDGARNIPLDGIGHVELPFRREVQQLVVKTIRDVSAGGQPAGRGTVIPGPAGQQTPLKQVDNR